MKKLGINRRTFTLSGPPPVLFSLKSDRKRSPGTETPIFEPYEESLPLQSGYYTFVIDYNGNFRVQWGNTSSHAGMVDRQSVGAAGSFRISRIGKLAQVFCRSYDYRIPYRDHKDRIVAYVIDRFTEHPAFDLSEHTLFEFSRAIADTFCLDRNGNPVSLDEYQKRIQLLDSEGKGDDVTSHFTDAQIQAFQEYRPGIPPRLYSMRRDQDILSLEENEGEGFNYGPAKPRLSFESPAVSAGKNNFVIDSEGWLIIGLSGHQILSGGGRVGGAGHLIIQETGTISEVHLNFSGHYRPPLTAEYIKYAFRLIAMHPLVDLGRECTILARTFDDESLDTCVYTFDWNDLMFDSPEFDEYIELISL
jgi:hypothetical protein